MYHGRNLFGAPPEVCLCTTELKHFLLVTTGSSYDGFVVS